jgi:heme exporter protein D
MTNRLRMLLARVKAALWKAITTEQVRPFVWVYYLALWVWGMYGTFFAAPATYVEPVMGSLVYDVWVWLHIVATTIVMCGLSMESRTENQDALWNTSIRLQTGGHACMFFVLLAYEVSAISAVSFGEGTYSIFVISPYVIGCLLLTVQGIAKIVVTRDEK